MTLARPAHVLIVADTDSSSHWAPEKYNLVGASITHASSIDELDSLLVQEEFDLIIVGPGILSGPTYSAMSDILMLTKFTKALTIANESFDASGLISPAPAQQQPAQNSANSQTTYCEPSLLAETIAGVDHASRNLIQIAHTRIDQVRRISKGSPEVHENLEWLTNSYHSIHEMFRVTRLICSPIKLELEYANIYKIVDDCWRKFQGKSGEEDNSTDYSAADRLTLVDEGHVRVAVTNILEFLLKTCADKEAIQIEFGLPDHNPLNSSIRFVFHSARTEISKRPNAIVELALSKRTIQLHGGEFEISVADPRKTSCAISFPVVPARQRVG